jgi:hypothetical protein
MSTTELSRPLTHAERGAMSSGNRNSKYTEEEIERGLHIMAITGRATEASEQTGIPLSTLDDWRKKTHRERYLVIREQVVPQIQQRIAAESEDLARTYAELERDVAEQFKSQLAHLKPHEAAGAMRNLTTSRGISIDKAQLLRGQPTSIEVKADITEILRGLVARGVGNYTDGTATEVPAGTDS